MIISYLNNSLDQYQNLKANISFKQRVKCRQSFHSRTIEIYFTNPSKFSELSENFLKRKRAKHRHRIFYKYNSSA